MKRGVGALAAVAALLLSTSGCGLVGGSLSSVTEHEFTNELALPPLAPSHVEDGVRTFELTAGTGNSDFAPATEAGTQTETWGFNGEFLGPTLRVTRGEEVAFEITNELNETTSVHWHGMHLPAQMDGGPHQEIAPSETWRPHWQIDQPAATLWYHPHPHGATERHVYNGLAGLFLIDDDASASASLPQEYGVDDIPVIVQDKAFDEDGQLELADNGSEPGTLGDVVMVNGTVGAYQEVTSERVRLRLLNGSTARTYHFQIPDRPMTLVATDGGLLEKPLVQDQLRLAPAERAEVVVEFEPGETVRLRSEQADLGSVAVPFAMGGRDEFDVLELRAADELTESSEPSWEPSSHSEEDALHESEAAKTRSFELEGREINGELMDMSRIDEVVHVGDTEVWEVTNSEPVPHSFHVHDVQFQVLTVDGETPPPELAGRKDTIYLEPRRDYRLLLRFEDFTDPEMPYMYHCHMLLHEDEGMMGQFVVVEPGDEHAVQPPEHADHDGHDAE